MAVELQRSDGSISVLRELDSADLCRIGGYAGPAGSGVPRFNSGSTLEFNVAGGTDTAGGILSWQNTLGYDIRITGFQLTVSTVASAACTISVGQTSVSGTTLSSNLMSGQDVRSATGCFNGGALSVICKQGEWLTASKASGASAGFVGLASFDFKPVFAAGAK
jgi:hypothetical protein